MVFETECSGGLVLVGSEGKGFWRILVTGLLCFCMTLFFVGSDLMTGQAVAEEVNCQQFQGGTTHKWSYTICKREPVDDSRVIYFFHGAGGDVFTWQNAFKENREESQRQGYSHPVVISVSFGSKWIFVQDQYLEKQGFLSVFWQEVVPHVESKLSGSIVRRDAVGQSMGGYNALHLAMDKPTYFSRLALISPAIFDLSPYAEADVIYAYMKRIGIYSYKQRLKAFLFGVNINSFGVSKILAARQEFIPNQLTWENISVFHGGVNKIDGSFPHVYISCGDKDEYGLFEGAEQLVKIVNQRGGHAVFHLLSGNHLVRDDKELVVFLGGSLL